MKIAIIEDDPLLSKNLKLLLENEPGFTVLATFPSADGILPKVKRLIPEIMLVDLGLPGISGIEFITQAKKELPQIDIIAHTIFDDKETVFTAIKAGATGYILKGCRPQELIDAFNEVYHGGSPITPKIARKVILEFQNFEMNEKKKLSIVEEDILKDICHGMTSTEIADKLSVHSSEVKNQIKQIYKKVQAQTTTDKATKSINDLIILSSREKEILNWIKHGKSTWDISQILQISETTVKFHVSSIMKKLNAVSRTHAVSIAISLGIIDLLE